MSCNYESSCQNYGKCYRCTSQSLLKIKGQKGQRNAGLFASQDNKTAQADDSWKDLEQQVADKLNNIPTIKEARRSRASGALWFEKGDIVQLNLSAKIDGYSAAIGYPIVLGKLENKLSYFKA